MSAKLLINGVFTDSSDGQTRESTNPSTGEVVGSWPVATEADVNAALEYAQAGKVAWAATPMAQRIATLLRAADIFEEHKDEIAELICTEMGKPIAMARGEAQEVCDLFRLTASAAQVHTGEVFPDPSAQDGSLGTIAFTKSEPLGVVACIGPFNFPVATLTFKTAPALVMGNAIIIKAPSECPILVLRYAELLNEAGFPAGVVQALSGPGASMGQWLVANNLIDAVTLTGSTGVGSKILEYSAPYFHRTLLELGGNDPLIITDGVDIDEAVAQSMCRVANAGQICCITKRFIVDNSIKDEYLEKLTAAVSAIRVGNSMNEDNDMGPLVSERAAKEVERAINLSVEQGAKIMCGGTRDGAFVTPCVLDCPSDADVAHDLEIFGPVWAVIGVDGDEEAIELANSSIFGLNGGVIASTLDRGIAIASRVESGTVVCNGEGSFRNPIHCFGGYKHSGIGREGIPDLLEEYSQRKTIVIRG